MKKFVSLFLSLGLTAFLLAGCGASNNATASNAGSGSGSAVGSGSAAAATVSDEDKANQLLSDLTDTYQELWPVILDDQYKQTWIDDCAKLVGEDNAEASYEKLASMVSGDVYGEDAVKEYKDGGGAYFCGFTEGLSKLEVDGDTATITGYDKNDKKLFSHQYDYVGMEETRGLYEFQSRDEDSGEFTYFYFAPDTSDTTYHIEFRYGSDANALAQYDAGDYAYWLASGISTEYDTDMVDNCINLFCTENLSEQ